MTNSLSNSITKAKRVFQMYTCLVVCIKEIQMTIFLRRGIIEMKKYFKCIFFWYGGFSIMEHK